MAKKIQLKPREPEKNPNISPFLGIGEGNVARAKADAIATEEAAKRATLQLEANLAAQGYDPAATAANAAAAQTASDNRTKIIIVIGALLILIGGLYFILKKRR